MLSSIILLTNASSPPGVIISTSAPVQTYGTMIFRYRLGMVGIREQTALGRSSFAAAVRVASSALA
jgi:hypothetical protein